MGVLSNMGLDAYNSKYGFSLTAGLLLMLVSCRFDPTFTTYLNNTVGPLFNPPIQFQGIPLNFEEMFEQAIRRQQLV